MIQIVVDYQLRLEKRSSGDWRAGLGVVIMVGCCGGRLDAGCWVAGFSAALSH